MDSLNLRIGSLCSGIGGLELGLEWAGVGHTVWQCEMDPFCRAVLAKHWPDAIRFGDVRRLSRFPVAGELFPEFPPDCDLICAGFPCQDISVAGNGAGLDGAQSGLWFEVLRVIREVMPAWIALENVDRIVRKGLGRVLEGIADLGFDAEWHRFAAADVGAPHRRRRWFLIGWRPEAAADTYRRAVDLQSIAGPRWTPADAGGHGAGWVPADAAGLGRRAGLWLPRDRRNAAGRGAGDVADAAGLGREGAPAQDAEVERRLRLAHRQGAGECGARRGRREAHAELVGDSDGTERQVGARQSVDPRPQRSPAARAGDGVRSRPGAWLAEPDVGRVVDGFPGRVARLKALGNAVLPQNAEVIGWRLRAIAWRLYQEAQPAQLDLFSWARGAA